MGLSSTFSKVTQVDSTKLEFTIQFNANLNLAGPGL